MFRGSDEDYSSNDDEDYVPSEASDGDSGDSDGVVEERGKDEEAHGKIQTKKKRKIKQKQKKGGRPEDDEDKETTSFSKKELVGQREKEEKDDDLWSSFLEDVGQKSKLPSASCLGKNVSSTDRPVQTSVQGSAGKTTVTVTKVFDFAGEEVKVTEEVACDSEEQKFPQPKPDMSTQVTDTSKLEPKTTVLKRTGGGLSSVLGMINKKPKMSVLEKSNFDWKNFKTSEGITDELKIHNKGKDGYVEKQKFLTRADQRQFEIERDLRMGLSKR